MEKTTDVLLCYRGHFKKYVTGLLKELRKLGLRVTYDEEILADRSRFDEEAEVDWVKLGDSPQEDTKWRAPLWTAVKSAETVAFALDIQDMNPNVINEIGWAIQSKAHTFFLMHGGTTDPESQGIIISSMAALYMLTTRRPEYPEFGYHFCGNLHGAELKEDVVVAANRIVAHLARCREGKLIELTGNNQAKTSDVEQSPDERGRRHLHRLQEAMHTGYVAEEAPSQKPALEAAMEYLREQEIQAARTERTDRQIERFRRAEEILLRIRPGPHELLHYIGPLVLQAASIEAMIHDDLRKKGSTPDFRPAVVMGTIVFSNLSEAWTVIFGDGYGVLVIDGGFVDFLYQVIKVSVSSAKATLHNQGGRRMVELDFGAVREQLRSKPELADGFYRCIRRYAVEGRPDSSTLGPPGQEIQMALDTYLRMAERYLVGLGYALITATGDAWPLPDLDINFDPDDATPEQRRTLLNVMALDYAVRSRSFVDRSDPLDAVAGCLFALSTIHVRQRMLAILDPSSTRWAREDPASFRDRLQLLSQYAYRQMIKGGASETFARQGLDRAWSTGTTPLQLWDHIEPQLSAEQQQGLRALPAWGVPTGERV